MKKKLRKITMIFDTFPLGKNLTNIVAPAWKLDKMYHHNIHKAIGFHDLFHSWY